MIYDKYRGKNTGLQCVKREFKEMGWEDMD
jgi:hypothetical protein